MMELRERGKDWLHLLEKKLQQLSQFIVLLILLAGCVEANSFYKRNAIDIVREIEKFLQKESIFFLRN